MSSGRSWIWAFAILVHAKKARSLARRAALKLSGHRPDHHAEALPRTIPKQIWIYWDCGEASAPPVVVACLASWRAKNPGWQVTVLDARSVAARGDVPPRPPKMTVQAYADLVRLRLLRRYGGVWADATVMCLTPLDHWLPPVARHGFFAFVWTEADKWFVLPNVHRIPTSWFLASEAGGEIVVAWETHSFAYWENRDRPHDYYWVHLILEHLIRTDARVRRAFQAMPKLGAYGPHLVHDYVEKDRDLAQVRAALASGAVPLQKLRWNWPEADQARAHAALAAIPAPGVAHGKSTGEAPDTLPRSCAG